MRLDKFREQEERRQARNAARRASQQSRTILKRDVYTREDLEDLGRMASRLVIVEMLHDEFGAQTVEWKDNQLIVYTEHTPEAG